MRTHVGIVGAGPAGLFLAEFLRQAGIDCVVLEARDREYVQQRVRAGVLEQGSIDAMRQLGVDARMNELGLEHHGFELLWGGRRLRIDMSELCGRSITVYGQQEVVKDLIDRRLEVGEPLLFEASDVQLHDVDSDAPRITFTHDGAAQELQCDFIAGCDGFHGISRPTVPEGVLQTFERVYPFAWLGILAHAAPSNEELIYANTDRGFALYSMRSPTVTRLYLQVAPDEDIAQWSDDRIWSELHARLEHNDGWKLKEGRIFQKGIIGMRSFVCAPMRHGRLFLAGDAAHIVPPTGAKGMNLAISDVRVLSQALDTFYKKGSEDGLNGYSETALKRVWRAEYFSWWMTRLLHTFADATPFERQIQRAELEAVVASRAMRTALAENYVGAF